MKKIAAAGVLVGIFFIIYGLSLQIPSSFISSPKQYVGGDAYNYIIEGSLRGGLIAGIIIKQALYIISGTVIMIISSFKIVK